MFKAHGANKCLVIIQCDSGHLNGDLIACARYRIYDLKARIDKGLTTHVLFVIHLPQQVASSSFVGFQGYPWISAHIDDLRPLSDNTVALDKASKMAMSELFMGKRSRSRRSEQEEKLEILSYNDLRGSDMEGDSYKEMEPSGSIEDSGEYDRNVEMQRDMEDLTTSDSEDEEKDSTVQKNRWAKKNLNLRVQRGEDMDIAIEGRNSQPMYDSTITSPLYTRLHGCIQAAASRLVDDAYKRSTKRVQLLVRLIPKDILDLGMTIKFVKPAHNSD